MHCCQAKYLGGDIWHWNHPISERHLLFPYLRGSGYPPRRQIKSQNPVWFWITQDSQDEIEFISSKLWGCLRCLWLWWGEKKWKFSLWANSLAAEMKGSSLGCFRVLWGAAACLTEKINKSYIDSALQLTIVSFLENEQKLYRPGPSTKSLSYFLFRKWTKVISTQPFN